MHSITYKQFHAKARLIHIQYEICPPDLRALSADHIRASCHQNRARACKTNPRVIFSQHFRSFYTFMYLAISTMRHCRIEAITGLCLHEKSGRYYRPLFSERSNLYTKSYKIVTYIKTILAHGALRPRRQNAHFFMFFL